MNIPVVKYKINYNFKKKKEMLAIKHNPNMLDV